MPTSPFDPTTSARVPAVGGCTIDEPVDVAVIGAGPAGLAAAVTLADAGCTIAVLDLADRVGGQYYRHAPEEMRAGKPGAYHHKWSVFVDLRDRFDAYVRSGRVAHLARHAVWSVDGTAVFTVRALEGERDRVGRTSYARALIIATGAHDRHVPFPGWTLPGVMAVGGVQSLLKGNLVAAGRRVVVAGTGPFLLSAAAGLLDAGVDVVAVAEANAPWQYLLYPRALAGAYSKLPEALGYGARLVRRHVPYLLRHAVTRVHGTGRLNAVTISRIDDRWRPVSGTERRLDCDTLAVGFGFTPQLELLLALGCTPTVGVDGSLAALVDEDQRTSADGVFAAGESTGVGGADLALVEGRLAGAAAARHVGRRSPLGERETHRLRVQRRRLRRFADAMHLVHPIHNGWTEWVDDTTLVCRCEEVSVSVIRGAVADLGAADPRTLKLLVRSGMGWCQGRICGPAIAALTAELAGRAVTQQDLESVAHRPLGQPVPLGVLAALCEEA